MNCPSCRASVPEGDRFCMECGAPLPRACRVCGHLIPAAAKFCPECGTSLAGELAKPGSSQTTTARTQPAPAPVSSAERRQLTVMFCDLVDSTALAARLDPEDLREVIGAYHACVRDTVARFDGFVAKYMGDGVLIYLGYPQAHEDDAERAVRAGLALAEVVALVQARDRLRVRIGIATGLVVVGDLVGSGEAQERGIVGETPNLAARLQAIAEPGGIVISAGTRRLLGSLFECRDFGAIEAKGFAAPVQAWQVLRESAVESRFEALHSGVLTPLVGRAEEIELLVRRWQRARSGDGQVVLLSGEPGIGKSRITAAVQERIAGEPHVRLRHFCSPYHTDSALRPIIAQLERAAGLAREDTPETKLDKLAVLLAPTSPPKEDVALLAELLSIPMTDRYPPLDLAPQRKKARTFEALLRQLKGLARQRPVLMVFEDVHWIDPTSRELLDLTIERARHLPLLLLVTFRPEFPPPWTGQAHVTMITLNRLDRRDGAALVARIAGSKALPGDVVEEIAERTDGVPLFVEELTKAVLEADVREDNAAGTLSAAPPPALAVPATLHALLLARLDRLGPAAKEIAQIGAVMGREFSYELLTALAPRNEAQLQSSLDRLVGAGLIFQRGTTPQAFYTFKHTLVQDAAYGTLLRGKRRELHARIATVLEAQFPDTAETQPELLAHHCTEAGLVDPAIRYWRHAGARARQRSADVEATRHLRRALALVETLPETRERDELELDLCIELGGALIATEGYGAAECRDLFARARALCGRLGDNPKLFPVLYGQWAYEHVNGRQTISLGLAEQFLSQAERAADRALEMIGRRLVGVSLLVRGRADLALPHLRRSLAAYDPMLDVPLGYVYGQNPKVGALMITGVALSHLGYPDQAAGLVRQGLDEARMLAHSNTLAWALWHASLFHLLRRDPAAEAAMAGEQVAIAREHGAAFWATTGRAVLSCARAAGRNASADAITELRRDLKAMHALTSWRVFTPCIDVVAAEILGAVGDVRGGLRLLEETQPLIERWEQRLAEAEAYRVRAELLLAAGAATGEAEASLARAIEVAQSQGAKTFELRAATSLARLWRNQGKREEARDLLAPIYGWFTEGFDTPDLKETKTLLDELRE